MRLRIIAVGRLKPCPELELTETYRKWLSPAPAKLGPLDIIEIDERKDPARAMMNAIARVPAAAKLIALDERGEEMTTKRLSESLAKWRDGSVTEAAFLIGGTGGLPKESLSVAHLSLSLGRMTWPHRLARVLLAEQLYRAASFLSGHPYHRE